MRSLAKTGACNEAYYIHVEADVSIWSLQVMGQIRHVAIAVQTLACTAADFLLTHPSSPVAAVTHGSMPCRSLPGQTRHVTAAIQTHACSGPAS